MNELNYVPISENDRDALREALKKEIVKCATGRSVLEKKEYHIELKDEKFKTLVSDGELDLAAEIAIEMLEEIKNINKTMRKPEFEELAAKVRSEESTIKKTVLMHGMFSERMKDLIGLAAECMRVGGAYYTFLSGPFITSAIFSAYAVIVNQGENEDLYITCAFFLIRAILKMHSIPD